MKDATNKVPYHVDLASNPDSVVSPLSDHEHEAQPPQPHFSYYIGASETGLGRSILDSNVGGDSGMRLATGRSVQIPSYIKLEALESTEHDSVAPGQAPSPFPRPFHAHR